MDKMNLFQNIPSDSPLIFSGYIMSRDEVVARVMDNKVDIVNWDLCPYYILRTRDFIGWLRNRSIDIHRTHSRLLRKLLRITSTDEEKIVLKVHGASITDTYWVKSDDEPNLEYEDVRFSTDYLSNVALRGIYPYTSDFDEPTPELTNTGSYEKCWIIRNNNWYMVKNGTKLELFSEYFTYRLGEMLGFNMAIYEVEDNVIVSKDFTHNGIHCFEPMHSFVGDEDLDYNLNYGTFEILGQDSANDYLDMLFLDAVVMNIDRHTFNYGILRDTYTGKVIGMAPNFDNNLSLISKGYETSYNAQKHFISDIKNFLESKNYRYPWLDRGMIFRIAQEAFNIVGGGIELDYVIQFCLRAYDYLKGKEY